MLLQVTSKWCFCFSEFKIFENAKFVVRKILERAALEKQTAAARANAQHSLQTLRGGRRPPTLTWGPPADRRRARARARARALSIREVSKSRIFYKATFKSIKVKAVQLVEFGNCAKARLNPTRPRKVMIKTFFELCLKPEINDFQMGNEKNIK